MGGVNSRAGDSGSYPSFTCKIGPWGRDAIVTSWVSNTLPGSKPRCFVDATQPIQRRSFRSGRRMHGTVVVFSMFSAHWWLQCSAGAPPGLREFVAEHTRCLACSYTIEILRP